ncbi:MAG: PTS sugar transporter subunit IIA [Spirochaetales bacterium]|nr:PTS sugar transporter subunit IIA [Spirochaetales bacterium]MCF7938613.1 PTS sugar transporter subunit IIA [Spirochaetales bacterium]
MNKLNCFVKGTVILELESTDKYEAISELINKAPVFQSLTDVKQFEASVIAREQKQSTGLGHGVAIAHGKIEGLEELKIALGVSHEGIDYSSYDRKPVHLLFVIANSPEQQREYLAVLSSLVRMVRDRDFRKELLNAGCEGDIEQKLSQSFEHVINRFLFSSPRTSP